MMRTQTISFDGLSERQREDAAAILVNALFHSPSAWRDMPSARKEVACYFCDPDRLALGVLDGERLAGWIGAIRHNPQTWELHPLVVSPELQRQGYGTRLISALEHEARRAGVCTIWLGTDDDFGGTNLHDVDLYPNVLETLMRLAPTTSHPYTFYEARGYSVVGVLPDADGVGKHDILMAKRIEPS